MNHLMLGQAQFRVGSVFLFKATILSQRGAACNLASAAEVDSGLLFRKYDSSAYIREAII